MKAILLIIFLVRQNVSATCALGQYSSDGINGCTSCAASTYTASTASTFCSNCAAGYYSTTGASSCAGDLHEFDFRGCTTGVTVADTYWPSLTLVATPYNNPTCSTTGLTFDGVNQYAKITNWNWGGLASVEIMAMYTSFAESQSRLFAFGKARYDNALDLGHRSTSNELYAEGSAPLMTLLP